MKKLLEIALVITIFTGSTAAFAQQNQNKPQPKKQTTEQTTKQTPSTDFFRANAEIAAGMEKMRTAYNPLQ